MRGGVGRRFPLRAEGYPRGMTPRDDWTDLENDLRAELDGVATFYSLIFRRPVGRHMIKLCDSISCHLTGYEELRDALKVKLGIQMGQTTRDNRFTLIPICCLGACDRAPCLMLDDDMHGPVELSAIDKLLEAYK